MCEVVPREGGSQLQGPCWGRQPRACNLLTPTQQHTNGPWAWSPSSPRDKESLQPVLSLLLCAGNIFSYYFTLNVCSFILFKHVSNGTWPTTISVPCKEGTRGVCAGQLLPGRTYWPSVTNAHYWCWPCSVSSMWIKWCFHLVLDCVACSLVTLISKCGGQKFVILSTVTKTGAFVFFICLSLFWWLISQCFS